MYHIIINPASRSGKGASLWEEVVKPYLTEKHIEYTPHFSAKPGQVAILAEEITREAVSEDPVHIIILGGDGTFNELLQGIHDFSTVTLGYIPTGSSNDLARDLGIPKDTQKALELAFETGSVHQMDLGCVTFENGSRRYFSVSCGMGFDAAVCEETNHSDFKIALNRMGLGKLAYLAIAVKQLLLAKTNTCEIRINDHEALTVPKLIFIAAMIHRYEGGGFKFCPDALDDDGILHICSVSNILPKLVILLALPSAFFGKHFLFPGVNPYEASSLQLKTSAPMWIHTDGEVIGFADSLTITCLQKILKIQY